MSAPGSHISFSPRQVGGDFSPIEADDNSDPQQPPLRPPLREGERGTFAAAGDEEGSHHQSEELFRLPESLHPAPSPTTYNCSSVDTGSSQSYGRYCASPTASVTVADFDNAALSRHHLGGGRKSLINERQTDHFVFLPTRVPADPWADLTAGGSSARDGASQAQPADETEHHQAAVAVAVPSDSTNNGDASASASSSSASSSSLLLLPLTRLCLALWHLMLCAVITAGSLYFILRVWRPSAGYSGEDALFKFLFYCAAFWPAVLSAMGVLMLLGPAAVNGICSGGSSTSTSDAEEKTEGGERVATTTAPPLSPAACSFATATAAALLTLFYGGGLLLTVGFASYFLSGGAWGLFILLAFAVPIMMAVVLVHLPLVASAHRQVAGGSGCRCCCCCGLAPIALAAE